MKNNSKALCMLLAGAMAVSNCPVSAQAAEVAETETVADTEDMAGAEGVVEAIEAEPVQPEPAESSTEEIAVEEAEINADTLTKGDFTYTEGTDGITITKYKGNDSIVDIVEVFSGETVIAIGTGAFKSNDYISKVILPDTVETIGESAFAYCDALLEISVSGGESSLATIGSGAFRDCTGLSVFPFEGVKSIGENAFRNTLLTEVVLPEGFAVLGESAFRECPALSKITLPSTLNSIGAYAFYDCKVLSKVTIPKGCGSIGNRAFYSCDSLNVVEFQSDTVIISNDAFKDCNSKLLFFGEPNSTAESAAETMGFRFNRYTNSIKIKTLPSKTEYLYGEELNTTGLVVEVDYTSDTAPATEEIAADLCNFSGYNKNKIGKQTVTVSYAGKETTFEINGYYDLSKAVIDSIPNQAYAGRAIEPELKVTGKETGLILVKDKDYKVEYLDDNTNVGTVNVKITGMGDYKGSKTRAYNIVAKSLDAKEISASVPTVIYNGAAQKPVPVVQDGTTTLTLKDYTVSDYSSNTNVGTGMVTLQGKGNYTGYVYLYFNIAPKDINNFTVKDIPDQIYTGKSITPKISVDIDEYTALQEGVDYTIRYKDNTEKGLAKVSITGMGNYTGTIEKTFTIKKKKLENVTVSAVEDKLYTGTAIEPTVTLYDELYKATLVKGTDYTIVYSDNIEAGTATITIEGIGSYEGTLKKTFKIFKKSMEKVTVSDIEDKVYTGTAMEPEVTLYDETYKATPVKGTDYKVTYSNNINAGTATITIEGIGSYEGKIEKTFTIKAKSLENLTVGAFEDRKYTGKAIEPTVTVCDEDFDEEEPFTLKKGTDYTVTYSDNTNAGTAKITIQGKGNYEGTIEKTFVINPETLTGENAVISNLDTCVYTGEEQKPSFKVTCNETDLVADTDYTVTYKNNVSAGTGTIVIEGKGNYKGTVEKEFTIAKKKLEGVTVNDLPGYVYTGEAIKPAIDLKMDGVSLALDKDFKVTYTNNTNAGEATVTIEGIGNYEGTITKTFEIKKKALGDIGVRNIPDHIYTGTELQPVISLELDVYTTLTKGVDYQVVYSNNVNVGTATVQVQGIGNYTGVIEKTFKITPKTIANASVVLSELVSNYDGTEKKPTASVVSGNKTLVSNTEYTVSYRNNKNIGTATVTIKGIGNYTGSVSKNFTIQAKKGTTLIAGAYKYKVTSATEVAFAGLKKSTSKKATIPAEVKIGGAKFKVTSISNKALKGTKVTSVTIGKNVKTIGSSAFEKCGSLKKITIKSTALKKVGKKAFKGINAKAKIKVPKKKLSAYQKLMKNKGQSATVKITK